MSEKTIQFGPFTPQEIKSIVSELDLRNLPYEVEKDDKAEKDFKAIDYENLVSQTHFRTKQYMAQIFYLTIAKSDVPKVSARLEKMGFPTGISENPSELVPEDSREDVFMKAKIEKKNFNRRMIAWLFVLGILCLMVMGYA